MRLLARFRSAALAAWTAAVPLAAAPSLPAGAVQPRIFSPNGDGINDKVIFAVDNPNLDALEGEILDLAGGDVADLQPTGPGGPTPDALCWDGRDGSGRAVPAGAYVYRIAGGGVALTGSVVVAR
jgi:hypothetical protein